MSGVIEKIKTSFNNVAKSSQRIDIGDISSYVVILILLALVTLFLVYLILNVNNKMDNFMKIYNDEQDRQYKDLGSTFNKIHESNKNLKDIIEQTDTNLEDTSNNLDELEEQINTNQESIQENSELMNNISNNISVSGNNINIGPNQELTLTDNSIQINLQDDANFRLCDISGENCSRIITKNYVEQNLPIIPDVGSN
tara:strand:+ start:150 stop:743 length:594 start_codon:yes stop_codon:yes gene_type:complete